MYLIKLNYVLLKVMGLDPLLTTTNNMLHITGLTASMEGGHNSYLELDLDTMVDTTCKVLGTEQPIVRSLV